LAISFVSSEDLAVYLAIQLKAFDILWQQLLNLQLKTQGFSGNSQLSDLSKAIFDQIQGGAGSSQPSTSSPSVKRSKYEDFSKNCELAGLSDSVLSSIFKENANNSIVWTKKPAGTSDSVGFSVKLPKLAVIREISISVYKQWYVDTDYSEFPTHLTISTGRSLNKMRPCGRHEFKDNSSAVGTIHTFRFDLNNSNHLSKYVTLKLKFAGKSPIALTSIRLKGNSIESFGSSESTDIAATSTKISEFLVSHTDCSSHIFRHIWFLLVKCKLL
jgi:hypothetical protein